MTKEEMTKLAIAGAILGVAYWKGNAMVRGGVVALAATMVAKRVPYVKDVL